MGGNASWRVDKARLCVTRLDLTAMFGVDYSSPHTPPAYYLGSGSGDFPMNDFDIVLVGGGIPMDDVYVQVRTDGVCAMDIILHKPFIEKKN